MKKIGILGPLLTYTHQAALKHYGKNAEIVPYRTIDEVFEKVESGEADEGVVPEENLIEGTVRPTMDGYYNRNVYLVGKVVVPVSHYVGGTAESGTDGIEKIFSKEEAFSQCSKWLSENAPGASYVPANSTAGAARAVSGKSDPAAAAIAPKAALKEAGLNVLAEDVGNVRGNRTMFGIIKGGKAGSGDIMPTGDDETTLIIHPKQDYPGQLISYLESFYENGINLTRIESRPGIVDRTLSDCRENSMNYMLHFAFRGHYTDANVRDALEDVAMRKAMPEGASVKLVGSYPRASLLQPNGA